MTDRRSGPGAEPLLVGAVQLPDGCWVRGRSVRSPLPPGPHPTLGVYLGVEYEPPWRHVHIAWPDFRLPRDSVAAAVQLRRAYEHSRAGGRLEIGCRGGRGRTGTAIAALAVLAGVAPEDAVAWAREHYVPHAAETPWQRTWVRRFPALLAASSS